MTIKPLVHYTDKILKTELEEFDFSNPPLDPIQLAKDLTETMLDNHGIGLAANQIGIPYKVFVMAGEKITCCFNPKIVDSSKEQFYMLEGCLSYPGTVVKIKRPAAIRVRYTMPNGETVTQKYDGLTARVFQHEFDHTLGLCHLDKATKYHRDKALSMLKKYNRIKRRTEKSK